MKFLLMFSMAVVTVVGTVGLPVPNGWQPPHDARPEAVVSGATLLILASILRNRLPHKD
ncbi:MAG: hypothetical protein ABI665_24515 [Vicinamibacterales bacterium]